MMHNLSLQTIYLAENQCFIPIYFMKKKCNYNDFEQECNYDELIKNCGKLFYISCFYFDILCSINKYDFFVSYLLKAYNEKFNKSTIFVFFFEDLITNDLINIVHFMRFCIDKQYEYFYSMYTNYTICTIENNLNYGDKIDYYKNIISYKREKIDTLIVYNRFYFIDNLTLIQNLNYDNLNKYIFKYFNNLELIIIKIFSYNQYLKKNINNDLKK